MPVIANLMIWKANGKVILFTGTWLVADIKHSSDGENYTSSLIFDSLRFSGIRLFRDMQMLPDSMQSFTPLVQGVAQSNALITVSQNGYTIYQKRGSPGPFTIADLQLSGSGSDLDVSIKEADGSVRSFWCPTLPCPICCNPVFQISIL